MGSPTDEYLQRDRLVHSTLKSINLGGLETKFEQTIDTDFNDDDFVNVSGHTNKRATHTGEIQISSTAPSDRVGFYQGNKKVGELYFTEDPMRVVELDGSFKQYANKLKKKLGI